MRKIVITLVNLLIITSLFAQVPQKMSYQAVVRDANDQLVTNTQISIELNIYQHSISGTLVYSETQTPTTNDNGLFSLEFGGQTGFDTIDWADGPYFLETKVDPRGGSDYTITGTTQLLSVPYALHAKVADAVATDTSKHYIGELYGGGIVFWVTRDGKHGLIASLDDLDDGGGAKWSATDDVLIGDSAESQIDGATNTAAIIAQDSTEGYAATLCNSYSHDGFSDWYLPAIYELMLLANNVYTINMTLENDGDETTKDLRPGYYWSSTEYTYDESCTYQICGGFSNSFGKASKRRVRAIRKF